MAKYLDSSGLTYLWGKIKSYISSQGFLTSSISTDVTFAKAKGIKYVDKNNNTVGLIRDNGTNLWIGAIENATTHHAGSTFISSGYSGTAGYETAYICVPNAANNGGTNYGIWHKGNSLQDFKAQTNLGTDGTPVATGSWVTQESLSFNPGTYLINVSGMFDNNSTGRRVMLFTSTNTSTTPAYASTIDSRMAVNGVATRLMFTTIITFTGSTSTTLYLRAYQNSGSELGLTCRYSYVRLF